MGARDRAPYNHGVCAHVKTFYGLFGRIDLTLHNDRAEVFALFQHQSQFIEIGLFRAFRIFTEAIQSRSNEIRAQKQGVACFLSISNVR